MIQISLPYIIEVVQSIDALSAVTATTTVGNTFGHLWMAKNKIDEFYGASLYAPALRSSRESSGELSQTIDQIMNTAPLAREITPIEEWSLRTKREQFKTEFLAELRIMPSFFVTQKGGFDTHTLLNFGYAFMPDRLLMKVPETALDLSEMGKAIAYALGTASGFHIFRVLEAVLRRYYTAVTNGQPAPKVRTIGTYVRALRKAGCGDEKVLAALRPDTRPSSKPACSP